jgi:energy-coupling factor transporter ATP-binding protein EcfA2
MQYDPDLILTNDNRNDVIAFLEAAGHPAPSLAVASNVQLVNLYHMTGQAPSPSDVQRATAKAVLDTLAALPKGTADQDMIRHIVRDELTNIAPRRLEIVSPRGSIILDGPLHYRSELVITIASLGHAIMLVGPAGCGKTTIGQHAARALQLPFYITSTITDTHELIGFVDGHGKYHDTPFRNAYEHGGVWVADEIDAWEASALLAANSALANGYANFPDRPEPLARHADFRMIATANTFGTGADRVYVGRNELDAASLDRFATIDVDYDLDLERLFAGDQHRWLEHVWDVRKNVNEMKMRHVVSSRAISMGSVALANGLNWSDVEAIYLFKGMSAKDRKKLKDNA